MPNPRFDLYLDDVGEALVAYIHERLGATLGLVLYEQGNLSHLPAPQLLDDVLPALFVSFERSDKFDLFMAHRFRTTYHFKIRFCRRSQEGENPLREMQRAISKIASVLAEQNFQLESLDDTPGLQVLKVEPESINLDNEENAIFNNPEWRVSVGHLDVAIFVESTGF